MIQTTLTSTKHAKRAGNGKVPMNQVIKKNYDELKDKENNDSTSKPEDIEDGSEVLSLVSRNIVEKDYEDLYCLCKEDALGC